MGNPPDASTGLQPEDPTVRNSAASMTSTLADTKDVARERTSKELKAVSLDAGSSARGSTLETEDAAGNEKSPQTATREAEKEKDAENDEEIEYPGSFALASIITALCLAIFLVALDNTIIATAIPKITDQFNSLTDVGWYGSAYMLTTCAFQLMYGKIYTFFSLKWTYLGAIALFELGSLVCAVAPSSEVLIVGRALAGLGSAGIFSGSLIILSVSAPLEKRPIYTGLIGGMYGIASVAGPLLGGVFTEQVTWRWCFYINLPIGAITIGVIAWFFTAPQRKKVADIPAREKLAQFDWLGTALLLPAVVCVLLALQWGGSKYAWKSSKIIGLFVGFGVLIALFVAVQFWRQEKATVPPRLLRNKNVAAACGISASLGSAFMVLVFYLPIYFQSIKGASPMKSGIMNLPLIMAVTLMSIGSGALTTVTGYYVPWIYLGTACLAIGSGLLTTFTTDTDHQMWIGYQFLAGAGVGMALQQPLMIAQTVLSLSDIPTGTALVVFCQTFGGAIFVSVAQNVFENKLIQGVQSALPGIDPSTVVNAGATNLKSAFPPETLPLIQQAYSTAVTNTFYASVAMSCIAFICCLPLDWISIKGKKIEAVPA